MLSYVDAAALVRAHADLAQAALGARVQTVALLDGLGRVLAEAVVADRDQPPFRRSTRDGFACRTADLRAPLRVVGSVRAGQASELGVGRGEAVEIMTGASVPDGADCVVMVEHVAREADNIAVEAGRTLRPGENIVPAAAEAQRGAVVVAAGTRIGARHIGAAAACGYSRLAVFERPRVAVLATGDELVELEGPLLPNQIRNSNSYSLAAQTVAAGGESLRLPIAVDEPAAIEAGIRSGLDCDLLLLSGGVSAGNYDFVEPVLLSMGAEFFFIGVLIQPGRPVVFGRVPYAGGWRYFFGLPGNPVSTMVTFALFVRPLLAAMAGEKDAGPRFVSARLLADVKARPGLTRFLPAALTGRAELWPEVEAVPWHGSGDLAAAARANCYVIVPADRDGLAAGEMVSVLLD